MDVRYGFPEAVFQQLTDEYDVKAVYTNHDYEPYATLRDEQIRLRLQEKDIPLHTYKDQVIFEKSEVVKDDGNPYTVFTPYSRKWRSKLERNSFASYDSSKLKGRFFSQTVRAVPSLKEMGFVVSGIPYPVKQVADSIYVNYQQQRDIPSILGTSRLSVHLRFGTISVRALARKTSALSETYLNELIWRDFYHMILWNFPQIGKGLSFKKEYDLIQWRNNETEFEKWCEGKTGYPIVDAGMRELNTTGFMHNRVRMIVASFLTKHLLIDWRWGEAYFAKKLLDFDLAANNGGWQWAAGSGCDAAPYFRVFNPYLQTKKFDPDLKYIRQWVPELETLDYPQPIVEHEIARKRCLQVYAEGLKKN
jgi:deoxyribodipyrimidine photo-lyase